MVRDSSQFMLLSDRYEAIVVSEYSGDVFDSNLR